MSKVLTATIRCALAELGDEDYQRRVWTGRDPRGEMSSFVECVSRLFDDSGLGQALDRGEHVFGPSIDDSFRALGDLVAQVDVSLGPGETIRDLTMGPVRVQAAALLRAIGTAHDGSP